MGSLLCWQAGGPAVRAVMVGVDGTGKTSLLHRMATGEFADEVPTIGFTKRAFSRGNAHFDVTEIGGSTGIYPLWKQYCAGKDAIILVVDSSNASATFPPEARDAFEDMLQTRELRGIPLLVLANKRDLNDTTGRDEIEHIMGLQHVQDRQVRILECSAATGDGIDECLQWLEQAAHAFRVAGEP